MSEYREEIVEMIDRALILNGQSSGCTCVFNDPDGNLCAHCTIREALRMSRSCIVLGMNRIDAMKVIMSKRQEEIEWKLRTLLESCCKGV